MDEITQANGGLFDPSFEQPCTSCDFVRWLGQPDAPETQGCPLCERIQALVPKGTRIDTIKLDLADITDLIAVDRLRPNGTTRLYNALEIIISQPCELKNYPCPQFGIAGWTYGSG
jgi:hypothetical protein